MDLLSTMRLFAGVQTHRSYADAARAMGVPRAAVSRAVQQLEDHLGVRLVHRTTRAIHLTPAGEAYAVRLTAALATLREAELDVRSGTAAVIGTLRIAAARTLGEEHVVPILAELCAEHPQIRVEITLGDRPVRLVEDGFDLALRVAEPEDSELIVRRLAACEVVLCASPAYLDVAGRPTAPDDLQAHRCVVDTNYAMGARWPFRGAGGRRVVDVSPVAAVNSPHAVRSLLLAGVGLAPCNTVHVGADLRAGRLVHVLPETPLDLVSAVVAVYPDRRLLTPAFRTVLDRLATSLPPRLAGSPP